MTSPDHPDREHRTLTGLKEAIEAIDQVIALAARELAIFDDRLEGRGYESPARIEAMRRLLLAGRMHRIRIAMHEPEVLVRTQPRLLALLRQFPSAVEIHRTVGEARNAHDPFVLADDHSAWHRLHQDHPRSVVALHSPPDVHGLAHRFAEIWELTEPAVSATTLGL
jgi:hypothetical protein